MKPVRTAPVARLSPQQRTTARDLWLAALVVAVALAAYVPLALRLAQGRYYEYYNLAFDFDPSRVLDLLTRSPPDAFGFKHPFMLLLRPLGLGLLSLGIPAKSAAGLVMAATGAARVGLVFLFLRAASLRRPEATALAVLFAVGSTQLTVAVVTETYGFASLSIILVWLFAQQRMHDSGRLRAWRYVAAVAAAGITITNAVQPFIAEAAVVVRHQRFGAAVRAMIRFGAVFGLAIVAVAVLLWPTELIAALRDPVLALKTILWLQTKGPTTGLSKVLETVLGFSFVSPNYTVVPLPETTRMIDFRDWSFPPGGWLAAAAWLGFLVTGTVAGLAHPAYRTVAAATGLALAFNIAFHLGFQFRGSVYIYTGHTHFLVLALSAGLAPWLAARRGARIAYTAAVLLLAAGIAAVNIPAVIDFTTRFDVPDTRCPAPCADGMP